MFGILSALDETDVRDASARDEADDMERVQRAQYLVDLGLGQSGFICNQGE